MTFYVSTWINEGKSSRNKIFKVSLDVWKFVCTYFTQNIGESHDQLDYLSENWVTVSGEVWLASRFFFYL